MVLPLLAILLLAGPRAWAQDSVDVADPAVEAVGEQPGPAALPAAGAPAEPNAEAAVARAKQRARDQRSRTNRLLLGLAGLLMLWLLARSQYRQRVMAVEGQVATRPRPRRRVALSHDELGHLVFEAARGRRYHDFRDLFLNGPEAAELLGQGGAESYLDQRSDRALHAALDHLAESIERGAIYVGVEPVDGGLLGLRVRYASGLEGLWPVGTVTEIAGGCRIHLPADQLARY